MGLSKDIRTRLHTYFKTRLGMWDYKGGWMKGTCPMCNKDKKYGVNLYSNRTNCFRCGYCKNPLQAVMEVEHFHTINEVFKFLGSLDSMALMEYQYEKLEETPVILPEGFKLMTLGNDSMGERARKYMSNRDFDLNQLTLKGVGYCGTGKYFGHIIMPFYINGELVYFNARRFIMTGSKYNNPGKDIFGIGKSQLIYNHDALLIYNSVFLVESVMNALTLGEKTIAIGGKKISPTQLSQVMKSPAKNIIIILDSDASREAIDQALKLTSHKKIKIVFMPEKKDVNDIGKDRTINRIYKTNYLNYNDILKLKHNRK